MENRNSAELALATDDRDQLDALLHPEFIGHAAEGMPFVIGGQHDGPARCVAALGELSPGISKHAPNLTASSILPMAGRW